MNFKFIIVAALAMLLLAGVATAAGVLIVAKTTESGLNDAAYYLYHDGKWGAAEKLYLAALDENPSYELARYNLATLYFQQRRYDDAIAQLETLLVLDETKPQYHYDLAINLVANIRENEKGLDQLNRALSEFKTANRLSPGFSHAQENIEVLETLQEEFGLEGG